ncbi:MAG: histidine triad nucleotide-binding protein [Firmicutes bacterium]|nr:histidine triad nucleotide-binding protein [Bacillota bacterium]
MGNCLFCKIINGDIPSAKVYEDEDVFAFKDIAPKAPVHILIVPKKHFQGIFDMNEEDIAVVGKINFVAKKLAEEFGIAESGYRLVANSRPDSGQEVYHLHYHLIGGRFLGDFCD